MTVEKMKKIRVVTKKEEEGFLVVDDERLPKLEYVVDGRDGIFINGVYESLTIRQSGNLAEKAIRPPRGYNACVGVDSEGVEVIVFLKKEKEND